MIIGLCGYKGAGKTTVTNAALELQTGSRRIHRIGFADTMYRMLEAFGIPDDVMNNKARWDEPLPMLAGKTTRQACDTLGTQWGRQCIGYDLWANRTVQDAEQRIRNGARAVIIDNVRFPNERSAIYRAGGVIIGFYRDGLMPDLSELPDADLNIPMIQNQADYQFVNSGISLVDDARMFYEFLTLTVLKSSSRSAG